jgi:hypothetical protein
VPRDMIDSVLGPENLRNHLGEGVLTFKLAMMEWRQLVFAGRAVPIFWARPVSTRPVSTPNIPFFVRRLGGCWDCTVSVLGGHIAA